MINTYNYIIILVYLAQDLRHYFVVNEWVNKDLLASSLQPMDLSSHCDFLLEMILHWDYHLYLYSYDQIVEQNNF